VGGPAIGGLEVNRMSACKTFLIVELLHWVNGPAGDPAGHTLA